ncbi:hypothetical protein [Tabrizicola sp. BL-A-41-H6]|uniref:hypothetical protein n=1 Tax=Tabrizicola sp. BL-A-41-H6 TaxID=3421107 RepID=UPI003D66FEC8
MKLAENSHPYMLGDPKLDLSKDGASVTRIVEITVREGNPRGGAGRTKANMS